MIEGIVLVKIRFYVGQAGYSGWGTIASEIEPVAKTQTQKISKIQFQELPSVDYTIPRAT